MKLKTTITLILLSFLIYSFPVLAEPSRAYESAIKASLKRDWFKRRSDRETKGSIAWTTRAKTAAQPWAASSCWKNKENPFMNFQIERALLFIVGGVSTEAWYCAAEENYWISECGSDMATSCRSAGPFEFIPENDSLFQAQVQGLNE
jgi:hypothetical protein